MDKMGERVEAAQAVAASVAQMDLAVREVQPVVERLGIVIDNMSTGLAQLRKTRPWPSDPDVISVFPDEFDQVISGLETQIYGSITQLQFYDRLVQHMQHLQDFLSGIAGELANETADDEVWERLRSRLRFRLISAAQRELLDAVLPPPDGAGFNAQQARDEHAAQGTVELF